VTQKCSTDFFFKSKARKRNSSKLRVEKENSKWQKFKKINNTKGRRY
jgi:hypothetical protein